MSGWLVFAGLLTFLSFLLTFRMGMIVEREKHNVESKRREAPANPSRRNEEG